MSLLDDIWYQSHPLNLPLRPVSAALGAVVKIRRQAYQKGWLEQQQFDTPVIVVGNITVGGTGKTPFIIWLGKLLQKQGIRIGIVSRGYKAQIENTPHEINADMTAIDGGNTGNARAVGSDLPEQVGDEPYMIFQHLQCPMAIGSERVKAIELLLQKHELDLILSDDGMQHYAMGRDMEIAMIDGTRGLGNGCLLPAGPLREPPERLQSVDFIVANTQAYNSAPVMSLAALSAISLDGQQSRPLEEFKGQQVHAVAGIGNPQRFFTTLKEQGIDIIEHAFPDHYAFKAEDLQFNDALPVLMTEKDAVKCRKLGGDKLWYVPVEAELPSAFSDQLLQAIQNMIQRFRDRNG